MFLKQAALSLAGHWVTDSRQNRTEKREQALAEGTRGIQGHVYSTACRSGSSRGCTGMRKQHIRRIASFLEKAGPGRCSDCTALVQACLPESDPKDPLQENEQQLLVPAVPVSGAEAGGSLELAGHSVSFRFSEGHAT